MWRGTKDILMTVNARVRGKLSRVAPIIARAMNMPAAICHRDS
jgi:hypothetical protein